MEDSSSSNSDSSDNYSLSDDSSNDFSNDDSSNDSSNDEESTTQNIKKFDKVKYYEFLNSLYPSHYSKNKIVLNIIHCNFNYRKICIKIILFRIPFCKKE